MQIAVLDRDVLERDMRERDKWRENFFYQVLLSIQVKSTTVLFIDQPVGTGYSYADTTDDFTRDNQEIAEDLVALLKVFLENYPDFQVRQRKKKDFLTPRSVSSLLFLCHNVSSA